VVVNPVPALFDPSATATASTASRLVVTATVGAALWLQASVTGVAEAFWWPLAWLGAGVAASFVLPAERWFVATSGVAVGVLVAMGLFVLLAFGVVATGSAPALPPALLLVALVPVGLDWHRAVRLRARAVSTGVIVLLALFFSGVRADFDLGAVSEAALAAVVLVWFALLLTSLWLLSTDVTAALARPRPIDGVPAPPPAPAGREVATVAVFAGMTGLLLATLVSTVDCLPWEECVGGMPSGPDGAADDFELGPGAADQPDAGRGGEASGEVLVVRPDGEAFLLDRRTGDLRPAPDMEGQPVPWPDAGARLVPEGEVGGGAGPDDPAGAPADGTEADGFTEPVQDLDDPSSLADVVSVVLALVFALLAAAALWWWYRSRDDAVDTDPPDRPWAQQAARRLMALGEVRGLPRGGDESITRYARRIAVDASGGPDEPLAVLGALVSQALFGAFPLAKAQRSWVDHVLDCREAAVVDESAGMVSPRGTRR
jgi:hypothetical protein